MVARNPALIVRCADVADVQTAVRAAAGCGLNPAVRCGGHSLAGFSSCEGGVVIDLMRLRSVAVDETSRRARAAGGCLLGSVDSATQKAGLVFPAGVVSHTGASGLILGGGTGWLTRLFGLSCDNVAGFTLVAADGSLVRASAADNPELFWALRGGGGNFGIVTEFELQLYPLTSVMIGNAFLAGDDIFSLVRYWREFMSAAPEELKWNLNLRVAPDCPGVPAEARGRPVLSQTVVWFGAAEPGQEMLDHIFSLGTPVGVTRETISFLKLQTMADAEFPHGRRYYTKSGYFRSLGDDSIESMIASLDSVPPGHTQIELAYLGGAAARVGASETAFGDRSAPFIMNLLADWEDAESDAANVAWVRALFAKLRPAMKPGVYVNFMSADEPERVAEAYGGLWERLVAVKTHYDPKNFFRLNQNIPPNVSL
jgi:FAD/FMN-containing dehydrogenase